MFKTNSKTVSQSDNQPEILVGTHQKKANSNYPNYFGTSNLQILAP